eukprot:g80833.t1
MAVLQSLQAKNLKNLHVYPRKQLMNRPPSCPRSFLKKGESDITDLPKSFLISRHVKDRTTGEVFRQLQFVGQKVIDPVRSALLKDLPQAVWDKEIAPDIAKMAVQYDGHGNIIHRPVEQLPVFTNSSGCVISKSCAESMLTAGPRERPRHLRPRLHRRPRNLHRPLASRKEKQPDGQWEGKASLAQRKLRRRLAVWRQWSVPNRLSRLHLIPSNCS